MNDVELSLQVVKLIEDEPNVKAVVDYEDEDVNDDGEVEIDFEELVGSKIENEPGFVGD